jgi:hypothetical protein
MKAATNTGVMLVKKLGLNYREAARRAAKTHGVGEVKIEPLRQRIGHEFTKPPTKDRDLLLDDETEEFLKNIIMAFSTLSNPLCSGEVRVLAQVLGRLPGEPRALRGRLFSESDFSQTSFLNSTSSILSDKIFRGESLSYRRFTSTQESRPSKRKQMLRSAISAIRLLCSSYDHCGTIEAG